MRITSWNVNAIKSVLQYYPWCENKTYEGLLDTLGGDITCVQETKIKTSQITKDMACLNGYDSFFSSYSMGRHGTAIFTKRETVVPLKAEEGLTSLLLPKDLKGSARIGGYPDEEEQIALTDKELEALDSEGRTTICDFGLFVLINLYCPNETNDSRIPFKNNFNSLVNLRARNLIAAGREVIIVGDLNIVYTGIKEDSEEEKTGIYSDYEPVKWLAGFTGKNGPMIDITRKYHPKRSDMNTCWNTKLNARPGNLGARLDYILITPGLLQWIKFSDIQSLLLGSDHCPIFVDFYDEIEIPGRGLIKLWDEMNLGRDRDVERAPPALAARNMDAFNGKQRSVGSYFSGAGSIAPTVKKSVSGPSTSLPTVVPAPSRLASSSLADSLARIRTDAGPSKSVKGKGKETRLLDGQKTLSGFFAPPKATVKAKAKVKVIPKSASPSPQPNFCQSQSPSSSSTSSSLPSQLQTSDLESATACSAEAIQAWSLLLSKKEVPMCTTHNEPCQQYTVNKAGINKGRKFWMCSRPVGPGYDQGQAKIHVDVKYRCNFFEFETSVKRPPGTALDSKAKRARTG